MPASSSAGQRRHNRLNWVALRTLRQLPKVVGETSAGEPIVEIRSVRLVLRDGAAHLSRMTTCSKCERELPGAAVLAPSDLDHPPQPVICKDCVRAASAPLLRSEHRTPKPVVQGTASTDGPPPGDQRLAALERRIAELAARLEGQQRDTDAALKGGVDQRTAPAADVEARLAALWATVDKLVRAERGSGEFASSERVRALQAQLTEVQERVELDGATIRALQRVAEEAAPERGRVDGIDARMSQLRAETAAEAKRVEALEEHLRQLNARWDEAGSEATRVLDQVTERLDRQAERMARAAAAGDPRLEAVEKRLEEAVGRLAEIDGVVRQGTDEARAALAAVQSAAGRLENIETTDAERAAQLAELLDLQTTLDTGLGELRSEIEQVRETAQRAGGVDSGSAGTVEIPPLPVEPERGRRVGRKSADAMAGLAASVRTVVDGHRQLRSEVLTLQNQAETAIRASARATAQATDIGPLRQDVRALRDEVAAQNEAVAALTKTLDGLRRAARDQPKPAEAAKKATKAVKATKAKATRRP